MDPDILDNFEKNIFYHGTSEEHAAAIAKEGFRAWFVDEEGSRYDGGGSLGHGIYITSNWRTALLFGPVLLHVTIRPGTRLLNSALPPDKKTIEYLQREFGRDILRQPPWKVLPKNKKLTLPEMINLFRYHYWHSWEAMYAKGFLKWTERRMAHRQLLHRYKSLLVRYGFGGYGNPENDMGIVVFAEDRLAVTNVVAHVPSTLYDDLAMTDFHRFLRVEELQKFCQRENSRPPQKPI